VSVGTHQPSEDEEKRSCATSEKVLCVGPLQSSPSSQVGDLTAGTSSAFGPSGSVSMPSFDEQHPRACSTRRIWMSKLLV
jgi:hypothetical protein